MTDTGSNIENGVDKLRSDNGATEGNPPRYPDTGISVLIVGGGIGGLMCALECWRKGHQVRVLERSRWEQLIGDSLSVGPTAVDIISRNWPALYRDFQSQSYHPQISYMKYTGEKLCGPAPFGYTSKDPSDTKAPLEIHRHIRPDLHRILFAQVQRCGITVENDKRATDYYEDTITGKGGVILADGSRHEADLVVAADGIHTPSWKLVGGSQPDARSSGNSVYRTAFPVSHMLADPILAEAFPLLDGGRCSAIHLYIGAGLQGVVWRTDAHFSWALTHKDTGSAEESWSNRTPASEALANLDGTGYDPLFRRAIACTPPTAALVDWKLMFRDSQPQWVSPGGRVLQLGDSAHTFLPTSGNGATQAIEDAASLATCLSLLAGERRQIPLAVKVHCKLRFERVDCIQLLGFVNQFKRRKPDFEKIRENPELVKVSFAPWIWDHDPEAYAVESWGKVVQSFVDGKDGWRNTNVPPGFEYRKWTLDDMLRLEKEGKDIEVVGDWD